MKRGYIAKKELEKILGWWIADTSYHKCVQVTCDIKIGATGEDNRGKTHLVMISETECESTYGDNYCNIYKNIEDCKESLIKHIERDISHYQRLSNNVSPPKDMLDWVKSKENSTWYIKKMIESNDRDREFGKKQLERICEMVENVRKFGDSKYMEIYNRDIKESSIRETK